jgi:hypothetical protein
MKRKLLYSLLGIALCVGTTQAQTTLAFEDFTDNGEPSINDWVIANSGDPTGTWFRATSTSLSSSDNGCVAAYGFNTETGNTHDGSSTITSPAYSTLGSDVVFLEFEHLHSIYQNSSYRRVYVSTDSTTWSKVYEKQEAADPSIELVDVTAELANQAKVYIRFEYASIGDQYWLIDAIKLIEPVANNLSLNGLSVPGFVGINTPTTLSLNISNLGSSDVTEFEVSTSINGGTPLVETIANVSIPSLSSTTLNVPTPVSISASGFYSIEVEITSVNTLVDADLSNNVLTAKTVVYNPETSVSRVPLFEVFTSSTCGPCLAGNNQLHGIIDPKDQSEFVQIKFQQDFPGVGDGYVTTEALARRAYYLVNSIPRMEIDGGWDQNAASFTNNLYNSSLAVPAVFGMVGEHSIDVETQTVNYSVNVTPTFDAQDGDATLYIAIVEKRTVNNVGNNGETEFFYVMKKMIQGANGQPLNNVVTGQDIEISGSYTFPGNYRDPANANNPINLATEHSVEEFDDLTVVSWIQYDPTKQVLQANNSDNTISIQVLETAKVSDLKLFPNPADEFMTATFTMENKAKVELNIINNATGQVVRTKSLQLYAGNATVEFNTTDLANGIYTLSVMAEGKVIASQNAVITH